MGPRDASDPVTKSLADFVQDIPYFLTFDLIPPLSVMNEEFGSGGDDAGMSGGCVWEPFAIMQEDFAELVQELKNRGMRHVEPSPWVKKQAAQAGDEQLMLEYHLKAVRAGQELARFISAYVEQYRTRKRLLVLVFTITLLR